MKRRAVFFVILCVMFVIGGASNKTEEEKFLPQFSSSSKVHPNNFFDPRYFKPESSQKPIPSNKKILGAVVPHHLLAHRMIADVFSKMQNAPPNLLILVGPNHKNLGPKILVSRLGWQTPFGTVEADIEAVDYLVSYNIAKEDEYVFDGEHSMGNLMPFIKYYLPNTKVLPIICHYDVSKKETKKLAENLLSLIQNGAAIVASVDFSHYLTADEAAKMDKETLKALNDNNWDSIFLMGNDHLDSPASLATLFFAMENAGIPDFTLVSHTNSGILLGSDIIETTSYMTFLFQK